MRISIESKGSFQKTERFLDRMKKGDIFAALDQYAQIGVAALAAATPVDSGLTASSWTYSVAKKGNAYWIIWKNTHVVDGQPVAILLQYGHGTGTGGFVRGRDYINPVIRPIFDQIANEVWKVVTSA
jgi:hypothetical protein